jgi:hypothetical protein
MATSSGSCGEPIGATTGGFFYGKQSRAVRPENKKFRHKIRSSDIEV